MPLLTTYRGSHASNDFTGTPTPQAEKIPTKPTTPTPQAQTTPTHNGADDVNDTNETNDASVNDTDAL